MPHSSSNSRHEIATLGRRLSTEIAAESALGEVVVARESGHYNHADQPDLVVEAARRILATCREAQ